MYYCFFDLQFRIQIVLGENLVGSTTRIQYLIALIKALGNVCVPCVIIFVYAMR